MQPFITKSETVSVVRPELVKGLEDHLLAVNRIGSRRLLQESGLSPLEFAETVMVPALEKIGSAWERGNVALAQVYMSGRICEDLIREHIATHVPFCSHPPMAVAVLNDSHLLGKRMVYSVLRASGFDLLDYGQIHLDDLVSRVEKDGIKILLVSVLMLASALQVRELRERLDLLGLGTRIVVGGAPFKFDENLWREVGATAMSATASGVVEVVKDLLGGAA